MGLELLTPVGKRKHLVPDSLTHNAGIVTATFGTKVYNTALTGLAANTRYQLYLLPNGNMVLSVNENSVGPAGQTSWLLVGSLYSNGLSSPTFGTFVNIEGVPKTERGVVSVMTTNLTGFTTPPICAWERIGRHFAMTYGFQKNGSAGVGASILQFDYPANIPVLATPGASLVEGVESIQINGGAIGHCAFLNLTAAPGDWTGCEAYNSTTGLLFLTQPSGTGSLTQAAVGANCVVQGNMRFLPVSTWLDKPIKDL